ncbi:MAG: hypothetical protein ABI295_01725, partial [Xanthomarina sp.]
VFISDWLQIKFDEINDDNDSGMMIIPIENIAELVNNGTVFLMYIKTALDDQFIVYPLPHDNHTFTFAIVNVDILGKGLIFGANTSNVSELENRPSYTIQYVLIPKSTSVSINMDFSNMSHDELMDYLQVE